VIKLFATASIRDGGKMTMTKEQIDATCGSAKAVGRFWSGTGISIRNFWSTGSSPVQREAMRLSGAFGELFSTVTGYAALDQRVAKTKTFPPEGPVAASIRSNRRSGVRSEARKSGPISERIIGAVRINSGATRLYVEVRLVLRPRLDLRCVAFISPLRPSGTAAAAISPSIFRSGNSAM
jgi:hypothetical protein